MYMNGMLFRAEGVKRNPNGHHHSLDTLSILYSTLLYSTLI